MAIRKHLFFSCRRWVAHVCLQGILLLENKEERSSLRYCVAVRQMLKLLNMDGWVLMESLNLVVPSHVDRVLWLCCELKTAY